MSDATAMLKELSQPWRPGEFVKEVIVRIAPLAGLTHTRAADIWYAKARRVEDHEIANIADALAKKNERSIWNRITNIEVELAQLKSIVRQSNSDYGQSTTDSSVGGVRVAGQAGRSYAGGR
jgi:hypothetical protein